VPAVLLRVACLACLALTLTLAATARGDEPPPPKHRAVATIFPLGDVTRRIAGDAFAVAVLLPSGASPHTFEPRPSQVAQVAQAEVAVMVGAGLDRWVEPLLSAADRPLALVRATDGIRLLPEITAVGEVATGPSAPGDPHVWLDPKLVRDEVVPRIATALTRVAPEAGPGIGDRAQRFQAELDALDAEIRSETQGLGQRSFIAFHSAWRYFADRYGLTQVGVVEASPGREPSARWIADLVRLAKASSVRVLLTEPQFSPRSAEVIASEIGARLVTVDPEGGEGLPGRSSYVEMMRWNAGVIAEALR
jgi:ABC-type Zn uptake system ZnuABC Zn-binding protein ZnuA